MDRLSPLGVAFMSPRYNIALADARRCRIDRLDLIYDRSRDMQRDVLNRPRHSRIVLGEDAARSLVSQTTRLSIDNGFATYQNAQKYHHGTSVTN